MPSKSFRYRDSALFSNKTNSFDKAQFSEKTQPPYMLPSEKNQSNQRHSAQKKEQKPPFIPFDKNTSSKKTLSSMLSFDKLKNLSTDDYIILFLIFMLIKDNDNPDWPLIGSLGYILFGFDE